MKAFVILAAAIALWFAMVVQGQERICRPNSTFMEDCKMCTCNDYGTRKSCTLIGCHKRPTGAYEILVPYAFLRLYERWYQNWKRTRYNVCEPGKHWFEDCNVCWCTDDGKHVGCTLVNCSKNGFVRTFIRKYDE